MTPEKELSKIAVFDIDRTLIQNTSAEVQLIHFLRKRKLLPITNFIRFLFSMLSQLPKGFDHFILRKSSYLYGLDVKTIRSLLPQFFEESIRPHLSQRLLKIMKKLKERKYEIILISGTVDFILDGFVQYLGADGGIGSKLEIRNKKFTGKILEIHPFHRDKIKALKLYLRDRKVDYKNSYGFGDSWADTHLLSLFGNPVIVSPGILIRLMMRKRRWAILSQITDAELGL